MEFVIIFVLTLLNGFFALTEIALVSVKKSRMEYLASKWNKQAKTILRLLENPENSVAPLLKVNILWKLGRKEEALHLFSECAFDDKENAKEIFELYPEFKEFREFLELTEE